MKHQGERKDLTCGQIDHKSSSRPIGNCKYTNVGSYKTAESIGMHFEKEYPDSENKITHVSVIFREETTVA